MRKQREDAKDANQVAAAPQAAAAIAPHTSHQSQPQASWASSKKIPQAQLEKALSEMPTTVAEAIVSELQKMLQPEFTSVPLEEAPAKRLKSAQE